MTPGKPPRRDRTRRRPAPPAGLHWLKAGDVVSDHADVVIIGGGATGTGLLWDLTLRGLDVVLVEQSAPASGTSGAFHGLLHSGARYAGTDPATASECLRENRILRRVAGRFIDPTGGIFARLESDDADWEKRWLDGARRAGLRPTLLRRETVLEAQPRLSGRVVRAYSVPDAAIDGFGLLWSLVSVATSAGARAYFQARVVGLLTDESGVRGVQVAPAGAGSDRQGAVPGEITALVVVNATGPWASRTAGLVGAEAAAAVPVAQDRGVMVVFNAPLVATVVNRLRPPADGDIFVPHGPVTILGTTSSREDDPTPRPPTPGEVELLLDQGRALLPDLDQAPPLRAYAGVRPLLTTPGAGSDGQDRGAGRGFLLVDHGRCGGPQGLVSVAGGKFTTFRAIAEAAGDLVCRRLGSKRPCRTAEVGIPRVRPGPQAPAAGRAGGGRRPLEGPLACECELVSAAELQSLLEAGLGLADVRRLARVGMGGCQGLFCEARLAAAMWSAGRTLDHGHPQADASSIAAETAAFRESRLGGVRAVQWGTQARLGALSEALERLTMGTAGEGGGR